MKLKRIRISEVINTGLPENYWDIEFSFSVRSNARPRNVTNACITLPSLKAIDDHMFLMEQISYNEVKGYFQIPLYLDNVSIKTNKGTLASNYFYIPVLYNFRKHTLQPITLDRGPHVTDTLYKQFYTKKTEQPQTFIQPPTLTKEESRKLLNVLESIG